MLYKCIVYYFPYIYIYKSKHTIIFPVVPLLAIMLLRPCTFMAPSEYMKYGLKWSGDTIDKL